MKVRAARVHIRKNAHTANAPPITPVQPLEEREACGKIPHALGHINVVSL
jgi:hypothetical protein